METKCRTAALVCSLIALFLVLAVIGLPSPNPTSGDNSVDLHFSRTIKKEFKAFESNGLLDAIPAQTQVFVDYEQWSAFWKKFGITPPKIDFSTNAVAAVFAGQKPSSGYDLEIKKLRLQPTRSTLHIEVLSVEPPSDVGTLSVLTSPYDIAIFAKTGEWKTVETSQTKRVGKLRTEL
jgi:hypothetical protein